MRRKRSAGNTRFRPGTTGLCEAQLWNFIGSPGIFHDDDALQAHWVAAESLEAALRYMPSCARVKKAFAQGWSGHEMAVGPARRAGNRKPPRIRPNATR